jgi:hypothetical protein
VGGSEGVAYGEAEAQVVRLAGKERQLQSLQMVSQAWPCITHFDYRVARLDAKVERNGTSRRNFDGVVEQRSNRALQRARFAAHENRDGRHLACVDQRGAKLERQLPEKWRKIDDVAFPHRRAASKLRQLFQHQLATPRFLLDFAELCRHLVALCLPGAKKDGVAEDHAEGIVQLVRDASRELRDGFDARAVERGHRDERRLEGG